MATHKVNIDVRERGAGRAAGELKRVDRAIGGVAKAAIGAAGALLGAAGLIAGFKAVIRAAGEQEQAERQLSVALGHSSKALLAQAAALQQVSTYGDETIIRAQALIAAFVDDEDQIKAATKATLDLAAAKGMDLVTAADLVSKTLGSTTNALSRYGIQVEGAVGSNQRLSTLTSEIAAKFGGQAAAAADTMTGRMEQAKNALGDAAEVIGGILAPALITGAGAIKGFAEGVGSIIERLRGAVQHFNRFDEAVKRVSFTAQEAELALYQEQLQQVRKLMADYDAGNTLLLVGNKKGAAAYAELQERAATLVTTIAEVEEKLKELAPVVLSNSELTLQAAFGLHEVEAGYRAQTVAIESAGAALQTYQQTGLTTAAEYDAMIAAMGDDRWSREQDRIEDTAERMRNAGVEAVQIAQWQDAEEEKLHQNKVRRDRLEAASHASATGRLVGSLASLNRATHGSAVVTKRLMQAQAIIDTYAGANRALASGPPPWNFVQAAAVIASGLANVMKIQAQKFARGGDFVTAGPQMIVVGDNPGGRERVQVQPLSSPNFDGPQGSNIELHFHGAITDESYVEEIIVPAIARAQRLGAA